MNQLTANIGWQNANATRNYPLVDGASRRDKYDRVLPNDILVDFHLWTGAEVDTGYYIGSIAVTAGLISLTVLTDADVFVARVLVERSTFLPYRNYRLESDDPSVMGWVAFGPGVLDVTANEHWVFDDPDATRLLPTVAVSYDSDGVTSLARSGRTAELSGIVRVTTSTPELLSIRFIPDSDPQALVIDGNKVNAIIFDLNEAAQGVMFHSQFLGPCEGSPESDTCRLPAIFTLNDVQPDCDGVLHLLIEEDIDEDAGALLDLTLATGQVTFDFSLGLAELCSRSKLAFNNPQLIKAECYDPCDPIDPGPFDSYNPQYGDSL